MISKNRSILRKVVQGYESLEPMFIVALAMDANIFLEGAHGIGKSTLGRILAQAADETGTGYRFFAADKVGIINLGGIPDLERSKATGGMEFIPNSNSLFGATVIVADELPRADKERQNYWLEILEEKTFQGKPIGYQTVIATGNNVTYTGNFNMDLALKSRFLFYLPAPDFSDVDSNEVVEMIRLNLSDRPLTEVAQELRSLVNRIRMQVEDYKKDEALVEQLSTFIGSFVQFLLSRINSDPDLNENPDAFVAPREFSDHMMKAMLGLGAYYKIMGLTNPLQHAGRDTIKYVIETRHASAGISFVNYCNAGWQSLQGMLVDGINTPAGRLQWGFAAAMNAIQKVEFWRDNIADICSLLEPLDVTSMAGATLKQIRDENTSQVGPFWHLMKQRPETGHIAAEVEGFVITDIARRLIDGRHDNDSPYRHLYLQFGTVESLTPGDVATILN